MDLASASDLILVSFSKYLEKTIYVPLSYDNMVPASIELYSVGNVFINKFLNKLLQIITYGVEERDKVLRERKLL